MTVSYTDSYFATIAYADIFDFPLTHKEALYWMIGKSGAQGAPRGIYTTRRACRLLEVERALRDFYLIHSLYNLYINTIEFFTLRSSLPLLFLFQFVEILAAVAKISYSTVGMKLIQEIQVNI